MDDLRDSSASAVTSVAQLLELVGLTNEDFDQPVLLKPPQPLKVPRAYLALISRGEPADPLLRQVLPLASELEISPGYGPDPLAEDRCCPAPGVLHKYRGRALLLASGRCAVHCRFCFRRHLPLARQHLTEAAQAQALAYLAADPTLHEVVLSGGDPLLLPLPRLRQLCTALAAIPHLRRLRLHTRVPLALPERVTADLLQALALPPSRLVLVVHANHAQELGQPQRQALGQLRAAGLTLLAQSVLLRGVNDSVEDLHQLCEALFEAGALPYYLHLLDRVQGAAHFDVPEAQARQLMQRLSGELPGYLVPKLVRDDPGGKAKRVVI